MHYSEVNKFCLICKTKLVLRNNRDVERKQYCSNSCKCKHIQSKRNAGDGCCDICGCTFTKIQKTQTTCPNIKCVIAKQVERSYKSMNNVPEKYIQHMLYKKERSAISKEYILELLEKQNGKCAISGIEMTFIKIPGHPKVHTNLSIDRIDSSKGYEVGNVHLVCAIVNIMKNTLSLEELKWWCTKICSVQER